MGENAFTRRRAIAQFASTAVGTSLVGSLLVPSAASSSSADPAVGTEFGPFSDLEELRGVVQPLLEWAAEDLRADKRIEEGMSRLELTLTGTSIRYGITLMKMEAGEVVPDPTSVDAQASLTPETFHAVMSGQRSLIAALVQGEITTVGARSRLAPLVVLPQVGSGVYENSLDEIGRPDLSAEV